MSRATATAPAAISVVNAIITGHAGASLAIDWQTRATVTLAEDSPGVAVEIQGAPAPREHEPLARLVHQHIAHALGAPDVGAHIATSGEVPMGRGIKSSSAAANAIALASNAAFQRFDGRALPRDRLLELAVDAALEAGVTITGAYDDASATMTGGLCVTDNRARRLIQRTEPDEIDVVLVIPAEFRATLSVKDLPYAAFRPAAEHAHLMCRQGRWQDALTLNGLACAALYDAPATWTRDALAAGCTAAGLSGKGPAFAAIGERDALVAFADGLDLPGGTTIHLSRTTNARAEVLS